MFESEDEQFDEPQEEAVSLDGLSEAFAEAIGDSGEDDGNDASDAADALPSSYGEDENSNDADSNDADGADDPCPINPQTIIESLLFVGNAENRPLPSRRMAELMRGVEAKEIPELIGRLNSRYESNGCAYKIFAEGSGYRLKLRERFHALRNKFHGRVREARLSQAAIDVLAIVAYRQPITAGEINRLRNRPCNHILSQLVRRRLLQIERPEDKSTKPLYRTTGRFLKLFGLDNIGELPQSEDVAT